MVADPYKVLGVSPNCSEEELKSAYRKLAKQYHPDLHPGDEAAARKMNEINAAYDQIKNPPQNAYTGGSAYQSYGGQSTSSAYGAGGQTYQQGPFTYTYYSTNGQSSSQSGYDPFEDIFRGFQQQSYTSYRRRSGGTLGKFILGIIIFRLVVSLLSCGSYYYAPTYSGESYYSYPYSYSQNYGSSSGASSQGSGFGGST